MKMDKAQLLKELKNLTTEHLAYVEQLNTHTDNKLRFRIAEGSWNTLECLEHLNYYGNFYLPEINNRISIAKQNKEEVTFKSGVLGNYFAKSMWPTEKLNTMNTFKIMNPLGYELTNSTVAETIKQLKQILSILDTVENYSLTNIKTSISISKWIKLRLGDTLRVIIYHNERHMRQIKRTLANQ